MWIGAAFCAGLTLGVLGMVAYVAYHLKDMWNRS